ncbi:MAG: ABC-type transport auxiliary lipoprotein family protein [Steroidobacteraceae bacterium]
MRGGYFPVVAFTSLAISACSIGRPIPQTTMYVIDVSTDVAAAEDRQMYPTLRMGNVRVAAPFAGNELIYRFSDVRYASDPYHAFAADPGSMLGGKIAEWLDRTDGFSVVAQPRSARAAPYVLEVSVTELYGDFRAGQPPAAVLSMQFALIDQTGARSKLQYERSISQTVPLPQASPEALVRGYGTALAAILGQVASELSAQF